MITIFHGTTKPRAIAAIFYDGLDHQKVLDWIRGKGIKCVYAASSNEILIQRHGEPALRLRSGMVFVKDTTPEVMTEVLFRTMYNIDNETHTP